MYLRVGSPGYDINTSLHFGAVCLSNIVEVSADLCIATVRDRVVVSSECDIRAVDYVAVTFYDRVADVHRVVVSMDDASVRVDRVSVMDQFLHAP